MNLAPALEKAYTKEHLSARDAQRLAEYIAFGPVIFQIGESVREGGDDRREEQGQRRDEGDDLSRSAHCDFLLAASRSLISIISIIYHCHSIMYIFLKKFAEKHKKWWFRWLTEDGYTET